jgi:hypothetical protein
LIHDLLKCVPVQQRLAAVKSHRAVRVFSAKLAKVLYVVVDFFGQRIVQFEVAKVLIEVIQSFAKTVTALQVTIRGQDYMDEHACS